jgi:pilus assembly protein TadC
MGKWLMYLYLVISIYCFVVVYLSFQAQAYQHMALLLILAFFNLGLFKLFRTEVKRRQISSLQG